VKSIPQVKFEVKFEIAGRPLIEALRLNSGFEQCPDR
jgi:hypothetical protein